MQIFLKVLILQVIAHVLTDYNFQNDAKAKDKNDKGFDSKFLKWHVLIAFVCSWVLSFQVSFVFSALSIALIHWLIDGFKPKISKWKMITKYMFFIDQFLHLLTIGIVLLISNQIFEFKLLYINELSLRVIMIVLAYLICMKPINILIKEAFKVGNIHLEPTTDELINAGKLIGVLERMLVLTFVLICQFGAVGFLLASKSILRYKNDNTLKTEYVLIGTMISFGSALMLGILIDKFM